LTKSEIVEKLRSKSGIKKKEIVYIIDNFLDMIIESVKNGNKVELRGFGSFYMAKRRERKVYSPIAGKKIDVPEKTIIAFKASKITETNEGA
jgi:DNA-binding protein HU-beta